MAHKGRGRSIRAKAFRKRRVFNAFDGSDTGSPQRLRNSRERDGSRPRRRRQAQDDTTDDDTSGVV